MSDTLNNSDIPLLRPRPVVLLLLDGWGIAPLSEANAFSGLKLPAWENLVHNYPLALLSPAHTNLNQRYITLGCGREDCSASPDNLITCRVASLTSTLAKAGLRQLKIAETERYAALTYFFNGEREERFPNETWKIISSETGEHTVKPRLALTRAVKELLQAIKSKELDFITTVWPILDLMAMTGDIVATKKAALALDSSIKKVFQEVDEQNGVLIISAVNGNAERIQNLATGLADTSLTNNPVPLIIAGHDLKGKTIGLTDPLGNDLSILSPAGTLADLAPTILKIMNLEKPETMVGHSLID